MALRNHYLFVCINRRPDGSPKGSCAARGSVEVYGRLKEMLVERGLAKVEARACSCSCLDFCESGPVVMVEPEGYVYGRVTLEDVPEIVAALAHGRPVDRLLVRPEHDAPPLPVGP